MQQVKSKHPAGTVCLGTAMTPRFYEFEDSLGNLKVPEGTIFNRRRSCDVAYNLNRAVDDMQGEWIFVLGDDHSFSPDLLLHLLDLSVDVVVPISPCKTYPFLPCVMHAPDDGSVWSDDMPIYNWGELSGTGLLALPKGDFIGQAGMLIRKNVIDAIPKPTFKTGKCHPGRLHEDLWFCHEIQELGFTVWVDQDTIFDHWFALGITARRHEGKWVPALKSGAGTIVLPDAANVETNYSAVELPREPLQWQQVNGEAKDA